MLITPPLANICRKMVIKAHVITEKMSSLSYGSTWHCSEHSQSKLGDSERKIFSNDLPNDFKAYTGFNFGSRMGKTWVSQLC